MTSQSPRIYTYKITFEEVPYYYYGVKKEKRFNEYYMGSPKTHKWCWNFYTPKKQILELFDYTDEGWVEAQEVEKRIIKQILNDKWCLNENCGGNFSLEILRKNGLKSKETNTKIFSISPEQLSKNGKRGGKKSGLQHKENGTGIFSMSPEERKENGRRSGLKTYKNGTGLFSMSEEEKRERSRKVGLKNKENGTGFFSRTPEQHSEDSRKAGLKNKENGIGIFSLTPEERRECNRKAVLTNKKNKTGIFSLSSEQLSEIAKKLNSQKWMCLETGHISTPGGLASFQKARGIDTSKRKRIE